MDSIISQKIKTTEIFDTYWRFAYERQEVFVKKKAGSERPWTNDEIIQKYKFTNTYRINDRVSQYLVKNIIYKKSDLYDDEDTLFRILIFKFFNKIETWELLEKYVGDITFKEYNYEKYKNAFEKMYVEKCKIYSNAYIMPSGKSSFGHERKFKNHLCLLEYMMKDKLYSKIQCCASLKGLYELLLGYPTLGPFLAFQYSIDINYSELTEFSEMDFVVAGPGAVSGIKKCFSDRSNYSDADFIRYMAFIQKDEFSKRNLAFQYLENRPLQLIDCQNIFCEVDKYSRVAHPENVSGNNRVRIKQKYNVNPDPIEYFYPPKWKLNII